MSLGIYLTGAFGQSQQLYRVRNEAKRGRGSSEAVEEQIKKDTALVLEKQNEAGVSFLSDPLFSQFYLFQPFVEHVHNVSAGAQENWFNNNVFYRRPQIDRAAYRNTASAKAFTSQYHHRDPALAKSDLAILPSPLTLLLLSDLSGFHNPKEAITNIAHLLKNEACLLVEEGYTRIQFDEPALVYMKSLGSFTLSHLDLLRQGLAICGEIPGATTVLHTYFGNAAPLVPALLHLPVNGIGVDCTETRLDDLLTYHFADKELVLGLVDARSTSLENPYDLVTALRTVQDHCQPKAIYLTPNTGTEYRGWTHGLRKLELLSETKRLFDHG